MEKRDVQMFYGDGTYRWISAEIIFPRGVSEILYYGKLHRVYYVDGAYQFHKEPAGGMR